jgi:sporulation protein YlmC with PRC-barrel domain
VSAARRMFVARELIGVAIVTDAGKRLGHVIDLELDPADDFCVTGLELGRFAWLDRLHVLRPVMHGRSASGPRVIAWDDVARLEGRKLILKPGAKLPGA